jgi:hypothetical protein
VPADDTTKGVANVNAGYPQEKTQSVTFTNANTIDLPLDTPRASGARLEVLGERPTEAEEHDFWSLHVRWDAWQRVAHTGH